MSAVKSYKNNCELDLQTEFAREEFLKYNHPEVPAMKCVYYPQIGFLVAVPILFDYSLEEQITFTMGGLAYQVDRSTALLIH